MQLSVVTYHSVEFVRKGRSKPEQRILRLDVPVELQEASRDAFIPAFVLDRDADDREVLYGFEGRLWRPVEPRRTKRHRGDLAHRTEATVNAGKLLIGEAIHRPLGKVVHRNQTIHPERLPSLTEASSGKDGITSDTRIVSDDRSVREGIARAAAKKVVKVGRSLWIQVRDPMLHVRRVHPGNQVQTSLLVDIHTDFEPWKLLEGMLFRVDRSSEAAAWADITSGGSFARRERTHPEGLAAYGVALLDTGYLTEDDVVGFARSHLKKVVDTCSVVIEAMPPLLRSAWQHLRACHEALDGIEARQAAELGLASAAQVLELLTEVRDVPSDSRARMMRDVGRLKLDQRRVFEVERIGPPQKHHDGEEPGSIDELDFGGLAP